MDRMIENVNMLNGAIGCVSINKTSDQEDNDGEEKA